MELQSTEKHSGLSTSLAQDVWHLLRSMLSAVWTTAHQKCERRECGHCEARVMWYQLALELVALINPENTAHPPDVSRPFKQKTKKNKQDVYEKKNIKKKVILNVFLPPFFIFSPNFYFK